MYTKYNHTYMSTNFILNIITKHHTLIQVCLLNIITCI